MTTPPDPTDQDTINHAAIAIPAVLAAADLVGRAGGRGFEVGHLEDTDTIADARWWASANFTGRRTIADEHTSPAAAADHLAAMILEHGQCTRCGRTITITEDDYAGTRCRWTRNAYTWQPGCRHEHP